MSINPFIVEQSVGRVPYSNEAVLSGWFEKKPITIQYDFPGYKKYGKLGQTTDLGVVGKNTVYGRLATAPYKYRPLVMVKIYGSDGQNLTVRTADITKLISWNVENVSVVTNTAELVRIWDNSLKKFADGVNDQNRYISSITYNASQQNSTVSLSGSLTTPIETSADYILVGNGLENILDYVIIDEELNLRDDRKPKALSSDVHSSALYRCRVDSAKIEQYSDWSTNFWNQIRIQCNRIFWDFM